MSQSYSQHYFLFLDLANVFFLICADQRAFLENLFLRYVWSCKSHKQSFQIAAHHMTLHRYQPRVFFPFSSFPPKWKHLYLQSLINYFKEDFSSPFFFFFFLILTTLLLFPSRQILNMFEMWGVWPNNNSDFLKT